MMKVTSIDRFNTSRGLAFIVEYIDNIKVGQQIMIDDTVYRVKYIQMQTTPIEKETITIFVYTVI